MFCHQCGKPLTLGIEKYCPFCGANLLQQKEGPPAERDIHSIGITDTKGDVFGAGVSGTGHIIAKEVSNIQGNTIYLINPSKEAVEVLVGIKRAKIQLDMTSKEDIEDGHKVIKKTQEVIAERQQVSQVLYEVNKIGKERGTKIKQIRTGDLQISTKELSLKEIMLKAKEHYYKEEYSEVLKWYDKAIELDPNDTGVWNNKGIVLDKLGKYQEAIECYDKAIELDPINAEAWNNKGNTLVTLGKYQEGMKCYESRSTINVQNPRQGTVILASSEGSAASRERNNCIHLGNNNPHAHGAFSFHLIEALEGKAADTLTGVITIADLIGYIQNQMKAEDKQMPVYYVAGASRLSNIKIASINQHEKQCHRQAILIGIDKYEDSEIPTLSGAENDARELFEHLIKDDNFDISHNHFLLGPKATRKNILRAVSEVFKRDIDLDLVIFYYSGHGVVDEHNVGYIASYDMDIKDPFVSGIKMEDLRNAIYKFKNEANIIMILDCPYSGMICEVKSIRSFI